MVASPADEAVAFSSRPQGKSAVDADTDGLGRALRLAAKSWLKHRCPAAAAAASFYLLIAFFPGVAAFGSALGLLDRPERVERKLSVLSDLVPADVFHVIAGEAPRFAQGAHPKLLGAALVFAAFSVGAASSTVRQLMVSLNVAARAEETRHWALRRTLAVLFAAGVAVGLGGEAGLLIKTGELFAGRAPAGGLELVAKWTSALLLSTAVLALLYRVLPNRRPPSWRSVAPGAAAAAAAGLMNSLALSAYLAQVADYQRTYGGLGALLGLAVWIWLAMAAALGGAELNYALEQRGEGGGEPPLAPDGPR